MRGLLALAIFFQIGAATATTQEKRDLWTPGAVASGIASEASQATDGSGSKSLSTYDSGGGGISDSLCTLFRNMLKWSDAWNITLMEVGPSCEGMKSPVSNSASGGFCLASLTSSGWYRAAVINPMGALLLELDGDYDLVPMSTSSSSGGSMFMTRYFALRGTSATNKWTFPCYLLNVNYRTVCFYHGEFGQMSSMCEAEIFSTTGTAGGMVFAPLIPFYGGPLGTLATYISSFYGFLHPLPIDKKDENFIDFWQSKSYRNKIFDHESNWLVGHSVVCTGSEGYDARGSTGGDPFNPASVGMYSFENFLPRAMAALDADGKPNLYSGWSNMTVYIVATISADTQAGMNLIPFSVASKPWGTNAPALKMMAYTVSFMTVKRLILSHQISVAKTECKHDDPVMDAGFTDNLPMTESLAYTSRLPPSVRPHEIVVSGPSSSFMVIRYLAGQGPLGIYTMFSVNACPFTQMSTCTIISQIRKLVVQQFGPETKSAYYDLGDAYQIYRQQLQIFVSRCGDPLVLDKFEGECLAGSVCHFTGVAMPGIKSDITNTPEAITFVLSMVFLSPSPVASRWVEKFIPFKMLQTNYYSNMAMWFPDFNMLAPQKGGMAFTLPAGHSLMDYMTFLLERLALPMTRARLISTNLFKGQPVTCDYAFFKTVVELNLLDPQNFIQFGSYTGR